MVNHHWSYHWSTIINDQWLIHNHHRNPRSPPHSHWFCESWTPPIGLSAEGRRRMLRLLGVHCWWLRIEIQKQLQPCREDHFSCFALLFVGGTYMCTCAQYTHQTNHAHLYNYIYIYLSINIYIYIYLHMHKLVCMHLLVKHIWLNAETVWIAFAWHRSSKSIGSPHYCW